VIVDPELALFTHTLNRVPADFYYEQKETFLKKYLIFLSISQKKASHTSLELSSLLC